MEDGGIPGSAGSGMLPLRNPQSDGRDSSPHAGSVGSYKDTLLNAWAVACSTQRHRAPT